MDELEKLTARDSKNPAVWSTLGRLSFETGDSAAAEKYYAKSVALKDDGRNWFNLGVVRVRLKDLPGALQAFERAAQHPDVKKQADTEAGRVREAMNPSTQRRRPPGSDSLDSTPCPRDRDSGDRRIHEHACASQPWSRRTSASPAPQPFSTGG